jgi:hypothetical protein
MAAKKKKTVKKKASSQTVPMHPATAADLVIKPPKQIHIDDPNLSPEERQVANTVREFHIAERTLELFLNENEKTMSVYTALIDERNQKLQAAEQLVRALSVTIDEFTLAGQAITYDAYELYKRVGPEKFTSIGGSVDTQTVYNIPKEKIEIAAALNAITPDDVLAVRKVTTRYHIPKAKG